MKRFRPLLVATVTAITAAAHAAHSVSAKEEKKYELPKTGVNVARGDGWFNLAVESNRFVVTLYDQKKKPAPAEVHLGLVRYVYAAKRPERTVLNLREDRQALISPPTVRPPHVFRVYLSLFSGDEADAAETYAFGYPAG